MCGYRLSRRKQVVAEHFDCGPWDEEWSPRYQHRPDPTYSGNPPESEKAYPRTGTDEVGSHSTLGKDTFYRGEHDQREVRDSRHEACVPRSSQTPQVPDPGRRVL